MVTSQTAIRSKVHGGHRPVSQDRLCLSVPAVPSHGLEARWGRPPGHPQQWESDFRTWGSFASCPWTAAGCTAGFTWLCRALGVSGFGGLVKGGAPMVGTPNSFITELQATWGRWSACSLPPRRPCGCSLWPWAWGVRAFGTLGWLRVPGVCAGAYGWVGDEALTGGGCSPPATPGPGSHGAQGP